MAKRKPKSADPATRLAEKFAEPFVRRAEYLVDRPEFQDEIDRVRAEWNRDHREFRIAREFRRATTGVAGRPLPAGLSNLPPTLRRALDDELNGVQTGRRKHPIPHKRRDEIVGAAKQWEAMLDVLAAKWWPAKDYPTYAAWRRGDHPASRFLAGCLLWGTKNVSGNVRSWITKWGISVQTSVQTFDHDPFGPSPNAVTGWAAFDYASRFLTREQYDEALDAGHKAGEAVRDRDDGPSRLWLPIPAQLSSTDFRDLEPEVLESIEASVSAGDPKVRARTLREGGMGVRQVAAALGRPESTVRGWVRPH